MTQTPEPTPEQTPPSAKRRGCGCGTLVLGCLGVILLGITAVVLVAVFVWWQWTSVPDYWAAHQQRRAALSAAERDRMADDLQNRLGGWFTDAQGAEPNRNFAAGDPPRPADDTRTASISFDEANAWLDRRLEMILTQRDIDLPLTLHDVMVASDNGQLVVAADVQMPGFRQVVSMVVDANMQDDGELYVRIDRVRIGRISLPAEAVLDQARKQIPPQDAETQKVLDHAFTIFEGRTFAPVHKVDDRQMRLTDWQINNDGVDLTIKTEPK